MSLSFVSFEMPVFFVDCYCLTLHNPFQLNRHSWSVLHCISQRGRATLYFTTGVQSMATKPTTTIRSDSDVKKRANEVFDEIGIGMSAAINTFLKAVIREGNMPFDIKLDRPK